MKAMIKPGHIRIKEKVYFEPDGSPEPPTDKKMANYSYGYTIAMKEYEASKQLIEVSNVTHIDRFNLDNNRNVDSFWIIIKNRKNLLQNNNQSCKAEVTGNKATIVELIK